MSSKLGTLWVATLLIAILAACGQPAPTATDIVPPPANSSPITESSPIIALTETLAATATPEPTPTSEPTATSVPASTPEVTASSEEIEEEPTDGSYLDEEVGINAGAWGGEPPLIASMFGDVSPDAPQRIAVPIADVSIAEFMVFSGNPETQVTILNPAGEVVEEPTAINLGAFEGSYTNQLRLLDPEDGIWQVEVTSIVPDMYGFAVTAETGTFLAVVAGDGHSRYLVGEPITVTAALVQGESDLLNEGTVLTGTWHESWEGAIQPLNFHLTESGFYEAQLGPFMETTDVTIAVTATNGFIHRMGDFQFSTYEQSARIIGVQSEKLTDADGDGKAESLDLEVLLEVQKASRYHLRGFLDNGTVAPGNHQAYADYGSRFSDDSPLLEVGQHLVPLSFPSEQIHSIGEDGPYRVYFALEDIEQNNPLDSEGEDYWTQPYPVTSFSRAEPILISGGTDEAVDTDGDGQYDQLIITLNIDVETPATYYWSAALGGQSGDTASSSGSGHLENETEVQFVFNGEEIRARAIDGPYLLYGVRVTQERGNPDLDLWDPVYTTGPYRHDEFQE